MKIRWEKIASFARLRHASATPRNDSCSQNQSLREGREKRSTKQSEASLGMTKRFNLLKHIPEGP
jgi:hypothetical protein